MEESIKNLAIVLGWEDFGLFALIVGVVQFLLSWLIKYQLKFEFDKKLEDIKAQLSFESKRREQSALVAELLSEWVKKPMNKDAVNKLAWEASLWLPDNEAKALNDLLAHEAGITTKELIIKVRAVIQNEETTLCANDITHFE